MFQIDKAVNLMLKIQNLLYREHCNVTLSPFSLEIVSLSILAGINGDCFEELSNCLFGKRVTFSDVSESIRCINMIITQINTIQNVDFKMNNFIYVSDKFKVQQSYCDFVHSNLNTQMRQVNFEDETLEIYTTIDQDIRTASFGRIDKILKCLPTVSRLMLVSHICFQSELKCKPLKQYNGKFQTTSQDEVSVRYTVHQSDFKFNNKNPDFVYVEMPYKNESINLSIIFPTEGASIRDIMNKLNYATMLELFDSSEQSQVEIHLPNMKLQTNVDLAMVLQLSGISKVFEEDNADFSKMVVNFEGLYLESVVTHSELILQDLSKIGSTIEQIKSAPDSTINPTIIINKPFIYFVKCNMEMFQAVILFSGVVNVIE